MPNLIHGQDPGGALRPIQVDDNGNLSVDLVSGIAVSAVIDSTTSLKVDQVSGAVWSITTGNSLEVKQVSGAVNSAEVSGIARQTNPTAVADAAVVKASFDDLGRQVVTPYQVRDLISTAYLALSTGTEATLLAAGGSGVFLDLAYIMAANASDAAVQVDFRDATAGGIVFTIEVPATATAGVAPAVPIPQNAANLPWTADMPDITGTTVNISALFIKNV